MRYHHLASLLAALLLASLAQAAAPLPAAPSLRALKIETGRGDGSFVLAGRDSWQQLLVTGQDASSGRALDVTRQAQYSASPAGVVEVSADGLVTPVKEGKAAI